MTTRQAQPGNARALTSDDFLIIRSLAGPEIGTIVDGVSHGTAGPLDPLNFAADQIVAALTGGSSLVIVSVLALGLGIDEVAVGKLGFFQRLFSIQRIAALSFPNADGFEAVQQLVGRLVAAGVPFSAVAGGSAHH